MFQDSSLPPNLTDRAKDVVVDSRQPENTMYRENYMNSLRNELLAMVEDYLSPVALHYGYSEVPLESNIKWRPLVLVLGNYSSGKSTLINEFLGVEVQATGQAPTDDSFTVITYEESSDDNTEIRVTDERDGKYLLNDPEYPFESLKKHGQRFSSHFRLKKVNSPFLKSLAIIDTPGMLDSITERDRGYNYQEVIGDLAQIADLVLVLFDPHKAGTVREAHTSLRDTLPARTFEDRVLFVLNRIDECNSLPDLLQVYGTLCWNLSQMTGRKDIPRIHLTYSQRAIAKRMSADRDNGFLTYLENEREALRNAILQAPRYRLDHLASFVETHGERLTHLLEALNGYRKYLLMFRLKFSALGLLLSALGGGAAVAALMFTGILSGADLVGMTSAGGAVAGLLSVLWMSLLLRFFTRRFHQRHLTHIDQLTPLENQTRRDSWQAVRDLVYIYLKKTQGRFSLKRTRHEFTEVKKVYVKGSKEIREALNELSTIGDDALVESETTAGAQLHSLRPAGNQPIY